MTNSKTNLSVFITALVLVFVTTRPAEAGWMDKINAECNAREHMK